MFCDTFAFFEILIINKNKSGRFGFFVERSCCDNERMPFTMHEITITLVIRISDIAFCSYKIALIASEMRHDWNHT